MTVSAPEQVDAEVLAMCWVKEHANGSVSFAEGVAWLRDHGSAEIQEECFERGAREFLRVATAQRRPSPVSPKGNATPSHLYDSVYPAVRDSGSLEEYRIASMSGDWSKSILDVTVDEFGEQIDWYDKRAKGFAARRDQYEAIRDLLDDTKATTLRKAPAAVRQQVQEIIFNA